MSPKKKPTPTKSAPKDELIDALFDSESEGETTPGITVSGHSSQRPPPPPKAGDDDRIYNFDSTPVPYDDETKPFQPTYDNDSPTLSIVRSTKEVPREVPTFDAPSAVSHSIELEEMKTVVHSASGDDAKTPPPPPEAKNEHKLQKLEDVLRRLKPQAGGAAAKPKTPLYDSETALAAVEAAKPGFANAIDAMVPPPTQPERAPTEPVKSAVISLPSMDADEKTVAAGSPRPTYDGKTEVLSQMTTSDNPESDPEAEQFMPTEIRPNSPGARFREEARHAQPGAAIFSSAEAALRQSENLRIAQKRISDLENELERVRRENESLRSAGETLRRRMDELQAAAENAEANTQEAKKIAEEERKVLKGQIQSRDREISEMKGRIDDAETRLESNFRKIRVRERDLEHRIEIIKAESQSITASKDRMILELKRQIDQISSELNHSKAQVQETFGQFKEKQETARRAVRALRIALTVLEGEEDTGIRKAE